jgi:hypothetical protein
VSGCRTLLEVTLKVAQLWIELLGVVGVWVGLGWSLYVRPCHLSRAVRPREGTCELHTQCCN